MKMMACPIKYVWNKLTTGALHTKLFVWWYSIVEFCKYKEVLVENIITWVLEKIRGQPDRKTAISGFQNLFWATHARAHHNFIKRNYVWYTYCVYIYIYIYIQILTMASASTVNILQWRTGKLWHIWYLVGPSSCNFLNNSSSLFAVCGY